MENLGDKLKKLGITEEGAYLVEDGKVTPGTQCIRETGTQVTYLSFGNPVTDSYIPIDEACTKCPQPCFKDVKVCQATQKEDAEKRGFKKLICPNQLMGGEPKESI